MNGYETSTPRAGFALAAAAMSAVTIGLAVALPAVLGLHEPADTRAPLTATARAVVDDVEPLRIEVIGVREAAVAPLATEAAAPHHARTAAPLRTKAVSAPKHAVTASACPYAKAKVSRQG